MTLRGVVVISCVLSCAAVPMAGPFRVIPGRVERCPRDMLDEPFLVENLRAFRSRRNVDLWFYSANLTVPTPISDQLDLHILMASWSARGGWKDNAQVLKFKRMCSSAATYLPTLWKNLKAATGLDPDYKCPIPAGSYQIRNLSLDLSITDAVPYFFYKKWRADAKVIDTAHSKSVACLRYYVETVPKYPSGR